MTLSIFIYIILAIFVTIHDTVQLECGYNEIETKCPANCPTDYCSTSEHQVQSCEQPKVCKPSECKCQFNTRRAVNGTCISTIDCPPFNCSQPNEEYNPCPPLCPSDDCSEATPSGECPYIGVILLVVECNPQCRCIKGYWRNKGICVPYNQCPHSTEKNIN